jgi:ABC-type transport system substrate-binding protein
MKIISGILSLLGLLILTACSSAVEPAAPVAVTTPPPPVATQVKTPPTPFTPGTQIIWQNLQVTMDQVEIAENFVTNTAPQEYRQRG